MGHLRLNQIVASDQVTENSSEKYDLSEAGKLTALILRVNQLTDANQIVTERRMANHITKLEVMGRKDKTIKSLRGLDLQAYHALKTGHMPPSQPERADARYPVETFVILFGRYVGDPLLYLDLAKDADIDFKVTNNFSTTTYWDSDNLKYTIFEVLLPDDTPAERGFIRTYEHSYWATVNAETKVKKLERGNKVFNVKLRGETDHTGQGGASNELYNVIRELTVDFRNKRDVIIDNINIGNYNWILAALNGKQWTQHLVPYISAGNYSVITDIGDISQAHASEHAGAVDTGYIATHFGDGDSLVVNVNADKNIKLSVTGLMPYGSILIPFDLGYPETPLLDTEKENPVYFRVHSHTSTGDIYMNVEELGQL